MEITSIYSFLVHPSKNEGTQPEIGGVQIPLDGKLFEMLSDLFYRSDSDCNIEISFNPTDEGVQINDCRNEIISLLKSRELSSARFLAKRLQLVTTRRSGLGLLFIVIGEHESTKRICLSRFPADFGIVAEEKQDSLYVELLERVFMKKEKSYKAAFYEGDNFHSDFWLGKAVDKQTNDKSLFVSGYWIREFLCSDFKTTSEMGTRRLASAIRSTMDNTKDIEIKEELSAAATLAKKLNNQIISMENFADHFFLSTKTKNALTKTLSDPKLRFTQFKFSSKEFSKHIKYRSVQMNNGALLTAPFKDFDTCFNKEIVPDSDNEIIYSTRGQVIDERLRQTSK